MTNVFVRFLMCDKYPLTSLKSVALIFFLSLSFPENLRAGDSPSSSHYRERFHQAPDPEREEPAADGEEDGGDGGGGSKGGKSRKKKKKKDDFRRVVGGPRDPIVPVTGVETGDLTAVTYKSPAPAAPLLEKAWNSTAWAPTYQSASRSLLGEKGDLSSVIQSDLIKHTGWKVDGGSISVSPDLNGGPYDVETGQAITFTVDRETSVDFLGMPGRVASAMTWDNPISLLGPYNPFKLARKNSLKNPYGIVQSGRRLLNRAGVLSAWAFEEGGVQITEDGGIGIVHDPSGKEALLAGAGIALWFTPIKIGPMLSAGTRVLPGASRALTLAASFGRGAWGRVAGLSQRAWGQITSTTNQFGRWAMGTVGRLGRRTWGWVNDLGRRVTGTIDDFMTEVALRAGPQLGSTLYSGIPGGPRTLEALFEVLRRNPLNGRILSEFRRWRQNPVRIRNDMVTNSALWNIVRHAASNPYRLREFPWLRNNQFALRQWIDFVLSHPATIMRRTLDLSKGSGHTREVLAFFHEPSRTFVVFEKAVKSDGTAIKVARGTVYRAFGYVPKLFR